MMFMHDKRKKTAGKKRLCSKRKSNPTADLYHTEKACLFKHDLAQQPSVTTDVPASSSTGL
jgi:hypothetical protein